MTTEQYQTGYEEGYQEEGKWVPVEPTLNDEQIHDCFQQSSRDKTKERRLIANAIEAEVCQQDTELIQYLLDALTAPYDGAKLHALHTAAIEAARKRLRGT